MLESTPLERVVDAYVASLATYAYPSDAELRLVAVQSNGVAGIDYVEAVAAVMSRPVDPPDADGARLAVVQSWHAVLLRLAADGQRPRSGVAGTGHRTDALGVAIQEDNET